MKKNKKQRPAKKLKLNFKNYSATNGATLTSIVVFRIINLFVFIVYPIVLSITPDFDNGIKSLTEYVFESSGELIKSIFTFGSSISSYEAITRILPFIIWFVSGILLFLMYFLPLFVSRTASTKGFFSFMYILYSLVWIGIIYLLQFYLIDHFPHSSDYDNGLAINDAKTFLWLDLKNNFSFHSGWMIINQIFHIITFVLGIWLMAESILIRKNKLVYSDLLTDTDKANSLVNNVLKGNLEFGSVPDENLKLSITKLKKKLSIDSLNSEETIINASSTSKAQQIDEKRSERMEKELKSEIKEVS